MTILVTSGEHPPPKHKIQSIKVFQMIIGEVGTEERDYIVFLCIIFCHRAWNLAQGTSGIGFQVVYFPVF